MCSPMNLSKIKKNEMDDHMEIATGKHLKRNMNNSLYDQEA